jgi:hypothetical protein
VCVCVCVGVGACVCVSSVGFGRRTIDVLRPLMLARSNIKKQRKGGWLIRAEIHHPEGMGRW